MQLEGSCHCGAVHFKLSSNTPYPYQRCYCSICRKTQGGGGYAINIGGDATTMRVTGKDNISIYHAKLKDPGDKRSHTSTAERNFCKLCGSALWLFSPEWSELIFPFASAIDTDLPEPPETTHMMLAFKASWVKVDKGKHDQEFEKTYPEESISEWHERLQLK
jgi:hypothetical protein